MSRHFEIGDIVCIEGELTRRDFVFDGWIVMVPGCDGFVYRCAVPSAGLTLVDRPIEPTARELLEARLLHPSSPVDGADIDFILNTADELGLFGEVVE